VAVFALDSNGDVLIRNGQLVLVTDAAECAAIELRCKFLFVKGEHFLDTREGVPYFQYVFKKNPDTLVIKSLFSQIIRAQKGIKSIISLNVTRTKDRKGRFSFRALTDNGRVVSGGSNEPFIVEPK